MENSDIKVRPWPKTVNVKIYCVVYENGAVINYNEKYIAESYMNKSREKGKKCQLLEINEEVVF